MPNPNTFELGRDFSNQQDYRSPKNRADEALAAAMRKGKIYADGPLPVLEHSSQSNEIVIFSGNSREKEYTERRNHLGPDSSLGEYIAFFDTYWQEEDLPQDWYKLRSLSTDKQAGFSINKQMNLLQGMDHDSVGIWEKQTERDILAFGLEYLSKGLVFPYRYEKSLLPDGTYGLVDNDYGGKDITAITSSAERDGEVLKSLERIKAYFLADSEDIPEEKRTPDGAMAVMVSPKGPTGMQTDAGKDINYTDSYFFMMWKKNGVVEGYTVKTDFSPNECRAAISDLTGITLPENAPLSAYSRALALIRPDEHPEIQNMSDVVNVFRNARIRTQESPDLVFKDQEWDAVFKDLKKRDLYKFKRSVNDRVSKTMQKFREYVLEGGHTREELAKATSATVLLLSDIFTSEDKKEEWLKKLGLSPYDPEADKEEMELDKRYGNSHQVKFGKVLDEMSEQEGCNGGGGEDGGSTTVYLDSLGGARAATVGSVGEINSDREGGLKFKCSKGHVNTRSIRKRILFCIICAERVDC